MVSVSLYRNNDLAAIKKPITSSFPIITKVNTKIRSKIPINFPAFSNSIVGFEVILIFGVMDKINGQNL